LAGIHAEIAGARYEYWSSFSSLPVDVVLAAGQKAKEEISKNIFWMLFTGPFLLFVIYLFIYFCMLRMKTGFLSCLLICFTHLMP
jgi:hypothetical protein